MNPDTQAVIRYRLDRAHEMLRDAQLLLEEQRLTSATSRIYYAMFYAAVALLTTRNPGSARRSGVTALFNDNFVKPAVFPRELARNLGRAFDM